MTEELIKAKELLESNGYVVIQWTEYMEADADECAVGNKDCFECSCNICAMQQYG